MKNQFKENFKKLSEDWKRRQTLTSRSRSFWSDDIAFFKLCTSAGLVAGGAADLCLLSILREFLQFTQQA